jgi:hypothetical protein
MPGGIGMLTPTSTLPPIADAEVGNTKISVRSIFSKNNLFILQPPSDNLNLTSWICVAVMLVFLF